MRGIAGHGRASRGSRNHGKGDRAATSRRLQAEGCRSRAADLLVALACVYVDQEQRSQSREAVRISL